MNIHFFMMGWIIFAAACLAIFICGRFFSYSDPLCPLYIYVALASSAIAGWSAFQIGATHDS